MEGTCNCKAVQVKVDDSELFTKQRGHICHCFNCRKTSGCALGSTNLIIESDKVTINGAENLTVYEDKNSLSGNSVYRSFCKTCGCSIKSETDAFTKAGKVIIKLGIYGKVPEPEMETFAKDRQDWGISQKRTKGFKIAAGGEEE